MYSVFFFFFVFQNPYDELEKSGFDAVQETQPGDILLKCMGLTNLQKPEGNWD